MPVSLMKERLPAVRLAGPTARANHLPNALRRSADRDGRREFMVHRLQGREKEEARRERGREKYGGEREGVRET